MNPTVQIADGSYFDLVNPDASEIGIETLARGLGKICRYQGNCVEHYSVAQHSTILSALLLYRYADPQLALLGLLHDASELVTGDINGPFKRLVPAIKQWETPIQHAFYRRFASIPSSTQESRLAEVHWHVTLWEKRDLMPRHSDDGWHWLGDKDANIARQHDLSILPTIAPFDADYAKSSFLSQYRKLLSHG